MSRFLFSITFICLFSISMTSHAFRVTTTGSCNNGKTAVNAAHGTNATCTPDGKIAKHSTHGQNAKDGGNGGYCTINISDAKPGQTVNLKYSVRGINGGKGGQGGNGIVCQKKPDVKYSALEKLKYNLDNKAKKLTHYPSVSTPGSSGGYGGHGGNGGNIMIITTNSKGARIKFSSCPVSGGRGGNGGRPGVGIRGANADNNLTGSGSAGNPGSPGHMGQVSMHSLDDQNASLSYNCRR